MEDGERSGLLKPQGFQRLRLPLPPSSVLFFNQLRSLLVEEKVSLPDR